MKYLVFVMLAFVLSLSANSSDLEKEKRWAAQTVDSILDGEAVYLESEGVEFLAIELPGEADNKTGIIVIHGIGVHPNWAQVVQPVRVALAENGLHTLSIQMPVLENGATVEDYRKLMPEAAKRIDSAVQYLKKQGNNKVVLVAHSLGTHMAAFYLAESQGHLDESVKGFAGISMLETTSELLSRIDLPTLDLYGSQDNPKALKSVPARKKAASRNKNYHQITVPDANHFFDNKNEELLDAIDQFISGI